MKITISGQYKHECFVCHSLYVLTFVNIRKFSNSYFIILMHTRELTAITLRECNL